MAQLIEEMSAGSARIRVDLVGSTVPEHVLENMDFLNYRLAAVRLESEVTLGDPDLIWNRDASEKSVSWDGRMMRFDGDWAAGPLQKAIVTVLALRMEAEGLHPFHSSAVRYQDTQNIVSQTACYPGYCIGAGRRDKDKVSPFRKRGMIYIPLLRQGKHIRYHLVTG